MGAVTVGYNATEAGTLGVRGIVAGRRLGGLKGWGVSPPVPIFFCIPAPPPPPRPPQ